MPTLLEKVVEAAQNEQDWAEFVNSLEFKERQQLPTVYNQARSQKLVHRKVEFVDGKSKVFLQPGSNRDQINKPLVESDS